MHASSPSAASDKVMPSTSWPGVAGPVGPDGDGDGDEDGGAEVGGALEVGEAVPTTVSAPAGESSARPKAYAPAGTAARVTSTTPVAAARRRLPVRPCRWMVAQGAGEGAMAYASSASNSLSCASNRPGAECASRPGPEGVPPPGFEPFDPQEGSQPSYMPSFSSRLTGCLPVRTSWVRARP